MSNIFGKLAKIAGIAAPVLGAIPGASMFAQPVQVVADMYNIKQEKKAARQAEKDYAKQLAEQELLARQQATETVSASQVQPQVSIQYIPYPIQASQETTARAPVQEVGTGPILIGLALLALVVIGRK